MDLFSPSPTFTLWLTGLSGAGKSTLAQALQSTLAKQGQALVILDGDTIRQGVSHDLGFDDASRSENLRRIAHIAKLLNEQGINVICATISPLERDRTMAKTIIGEASYIEVYISTPLTVCEQRDTKGLYKLARAGKVKLFTGISAPYDIPNESSIRIDTSTTTIAEAIQTIMATLTNIHSMLKMD